MPELRQPLATERMNAERDAEILRLRAEGWTYRALGERFGLSAPGIQCVISRIENRKSRPPLFGLSQRTSNRLWDRALHYGTGVPPTFADISSLSYRELVDTFLLGDVSVLEIALLLRRHGLGIAGLPPRLRHALDEFSRNIPT